jgi:hypothetical protein
LVVSLVGAPIHGEGEDRFGEQIVSLQIDGRKDAGFSRGAPVGSAKDRRDAQK